MRLMGAARFERATSRVWEEVKLQRNATTHDERFATEPHVRGGVVDHDDIG
jgi:hypothetical protein